MDKNDIKTVIVIGLKREVDLFCAYIQEEGAKTIDYMAVEKYMLSNQRVSDLNEYKYRVLREPLEEFAKKSGIRTVYCLLKDNKFRARLLKRMRELGYETPNFVHRTAEVDPTVKRKLEARPNAGIYVLASAKIEPNVKVGDFVLFDKKARIAKKAKFGQAVSIGKEVKFGENATARNSATIGEGSIIKAGIKLGRGCLVRRKSVVGINIPDRAIADGNPARILGHRYPTS